MIQNLHIQPPNVSALYDSGADPHHFDVDPEMDPACHFDVDADPDPTFYFEEDADPCPAPRFQIKTQNLEKCSSKFICTFWLNICKLMRMRIRIQFITLIWIRPFHLMRILADPVQQHRFQNIGI